MNDYIAHMIKNLDDETIDSMVTDGDDCNCGECFCCMAKREEEKRSARTPKAIKNH